MAAWIGVLGLLLSSPLPEAEKFSVTLPASPAIRFVSQLGSQLGLRLKTEGAIGKEVLLLRVKNVGAGEILDRVATCCGGEWRSDKGVLTLSESPRLRRLNLDQVKRQRVYSLRRQIERLNRENKAHPVFTAATAYEALTARSDDTESRARRNAGSPDNRWLAETLSMIRLEDVAESDCDHVVFSTTPTRRQYRLPNDALTNAEHYLVERLRLQTEINALPQSQGSDIAIQTDPDQLQKPIGKVELRFERFRPMNAWNLTLTVEDDAGENLGLAERYFDDAASSPKVEIPGDMVVPAGPFALELQEAIWPESRRRTADKRSSPLEPLDPKEEESPEVEALRWRPVPVRSVALRPGFLAQISKPENDEPLQLAVGDVLLAAAARAECNLVGDLSDDAFGPSNLIRQKPGRVGELLSDKRFRHVEDADLKSGWLTLTPRNMQETIARRVSRPALGWLCRSLVRNHFADFDELTRYALSCEKSNSASDFDGEYLSAINPTDPLIGADWGIYRFVASLTAGDLETLRSGVPLPIAAIPEWGRKGMFDHVCNFRPQPNEVMEEVRRKTNARVDFAPFDGWDDLLPYGLDPRGSIACEFKSDESICAFASTNGESDVVASGSLAASVLCHLLGVEDKLPAERFDQFAPIKTWWMSMKVSAAPGVSFDTFVSGEEIISRTKFGRIEDLPLEFRSAYEHDLAGLRSEIEEARKKKTGG